MAQISTYRVSAVFTSDVATLQAFVTKARKSRPSIQWVDAGSKKQINWSNGFQFWNFDHPANEEIYKYYDIPEKRVYQRKWNREHWGSAYEFTERTFVIGKTADNLNVIEWGQLRGLKDYKDAAKVNLEKLPQSSTEYSLFLAGWVEDKPMRIWSLIAEAFPQLVGEVWLTHDYGATTRIGISNGKAEVIASNEDPNNKYGMLKSTHADNHKLFGKCYCETGDTYRTWYWPEECREKFAKQQALEEALAKG